MNTVSPAVGATPPPEGWPCLDTTAPTRDDSGQAPRQIQELLEQLEVLPDLHARKLALDCLHALLALHGDGLARMMELGKSAGTGAEFSAALAEDPCVSNLLFIHGLHPVPLVTRLRGALDKVRPYLQSHGGNVELLGLEQGVAKLRLQGTCKTCPSSSLTLQSAVQRALEEACPDLAGFEVED